MRIHFVTATGLRGYALFNPAKHDDKTEAVFQSIARRRRETVVTKRLDSWTTDGSQETWAFSIGRRAFEGDGWAVSDDWAYIDFPPGDKR
jgi:hypothetical protein